MYLPNVVERIKYTPQMLLQFLLDLGDGQNVL